MTDRDDAAARPTLVSHNTETVVVFSVQLSNPEYSFYVVIRRNFCVIVVGNELYARVSSNFPEEMTTAQSAPCRARPSDSPDFWLAGGHWKLTKVAVCSPTAVSSRRWGYTTDACVTCGLEVSSVAELEDWVLKGKGISL